MSWNHRAHGNGGRYGKSAYSRRPPATGGCMFCAGLEDALAGHTRKQCPLFRQLKSATTTMPYIDVKLKASESDGYAAAGVLPWRRSESGGEIEILLAREYRAPTRDRGGDKLNFLGGKRLKRETEALVCAVDKIDQETAGTLSRATLAQMREGCPLVCWSSDSKYVLFVHELVGDDDRDVDIRCTGLLGAKRLEWVKRSELMSSLWRRQEMHPFAIEILERLTECSIMRHLEDLFDVAYACPASEKPANEAESQSQATQVAQHFDVVGAIRTTLEAARPDSRHLLAPEASSFPYQRLRAAIRDIPRRDQKKLCLKFHPDRLSRNLSHMPSDEETKMATKAMQVLNGLLEEASQSLESDIAGCLKELHQYRGKIAGKAMSGGKDNLKDVQDMLAGLSMGH